MRGRRFMYSQQALALAASLLIASLSHARQDVAHPQQQPAPSAPALLTLKIIGDTRAPLAGAQAYLVDATYGLPLSHAWQTSDDAGRITFNLNDVDASLLENGAGPATLVVRAPGRAWTTQKVTLPSTEPITLSVPLGKPVEFTIKSDSGSVPTDLVPHFFTAGNSTATWLTVAQRQNAAHDAGEAANFSVAVIENVAPGRVRLRVPDDCQSMWMLVHHEDFLRAYQAGPFDRAALEAGAIEVALPKPCSVTIKIAPDANRPHAYTACGYGVMTNPPIPDGGWSFQVADGFADAQTLEVTLADLAPGGYGISATTGTRQTQHMRDRADFFQTQNWTEAAAGDAKTVEFALETFDEKWWREHLTGDHALTLKITKPDGSPAAGKKYALAFRLQQFGRDLDFKAGELPDTGEVTFENLPAGADALLGVSVEGNDLGMVFIEPNEKHMHAAFGIPPAVGELAPDITLMRLDNGETFPLSSLRGKIVFLDFWASWCGPCQEPMAHNNTLMTKRSDWRDGVVIIGASIDDEIATIRDHVGKRDWKAVLQAFCDDGDPGWQCKAVKTYAVTGVPTAFLIDRHGKVAWTGHPSSIDVEKEIDKLLAQSN